MCNYALFQVCIDVMIYKSDQPWEHLVVYRCSGRGVEAVQLSGLKADVPKKSTSLPQRCTVFYLFIYFGFGGKYMFWGCWLSVTRRIKERHYKWSCQNNRTGGSWGEHPSLEQFIIKTVKLSKIRKKRGIKKTVISSVSQEEKDTKTTLFFFTSKKLKRFKV